MGKGPNLNPYITGLKESATLKINEQAKAARRRGEIVYHFGFGQSPFPVHPKIQIALAKNAHQKDYLPTLGLLDLREAICDYYKQFFGYDFQPDMVLVGPGSKELIFQALYVLEGPVFVPSPSWVSYGPQLSIRGKELSPIVCKREHSYKLQADELLEESKKHKDPQKILILNNPTNPTGALYTKEEIQALVKVCREENIFIISDEIYALVNFSGREYAGFHEFYPEGTIVTGGLSKSHAAGGYRLGFLAGHPDMKAMMKALSAMVSETFSAVSAPIQYAALEAYCGDYDLMRYVRQCTKIHKAVGEYCHMRFIKMGLECPRPEGAFYLFPDFYALKDKIKAKHGVETSTELAKIFFDKYQVAILPGSDFYYPDKNLGFRVATVDYNGEQVYLKSLMPLLNEKNAKHELSTEFVEENCPNMKGGCDQLEKFVNDL